MGRLERHLDLDLIARVEAGIRHEPKPIKKVKPPRPASDYRGARRNAQRGFTWQPKVRATAPRFSPPSVVRLNRSTKWPRIRSYADGPGRRVLPIAAE
jgi:hypothetical protein